MGHVPNVVFTCGAIPEDDGTVKIYWNEADTVMSAGTAVIDDLVDLCLQRMRGSPPDVVTGRDSRWCRLRAMSTRDHTCDPAVVLRALRGLLRELRAVDHAAYAAVAVTPTPTLDVPLRRLSTAADYSRVWFAIAALLALVGGQTGRRAALSGAASIGVTSAAVNLGLKAVGRRRPDRKRHRVPQGRHVRMPTSTSFPSGHSAAGFAFANAVSAEVPGLAFPLHLLAFFVAYSRVHTGVHYPSDAIAGGLVGGVVGQTVASLTCHRPRRR